MAVRFDAATDRISYTASNPPDPANGITILGWVRVNDRNDFSTGKVYAAAGEFGATVVDTGTVAGAATPTGLTLGGRSPSDSTEWYDGREGYWRIWSAVLGQPEIEADWASTVPVRTSGLWADWPLTDASNLNDASGNGRHLVAGSTPVTTEDGPPVNPPSSGLTGRVTGLPSSTGSVVSAVTRSLVGAIE